MENAIKEDDDEIEIISEKIGKNSTFGSAISSSVLRACAEYNEAETPIDEELIRVENVETEPTPIPVSTVNTPLLSRANSLNAQNGIINNSFWRNVYTAPPALLDMIIPPPPPPPPPTLNEFGQEVHCTNAYCDHMGPYLVLDPPPPAPLVPPPPIVIRSDTLANVGDCLSQSGFPRQWEVVTGVSLPPDASKFRVCSYNILCQESIHSTMYLYSHMNKQRYFLEWTNRWRLLKTELSRIDCDIVGLQEVEENLFNNFFKPHMENQGHTCLFRKKSSGAMYNDGCALFIRNSRFKVEEYQKVRFKVDEMDDMLKEPEIAQLARLRCLTSNASVLVSNTQIIRDHKKCDIKLLQLAILLAEIEDFRYDDLEPIIILGDFGVEPNSPLSGLITSGSINISSECKLHASGYLPNQYMRKKLLRIPLDTLMSARLGRDCKFYRKKRIREALGSQSSLVFTHDLKLSSVHNCTNSITCDVSTFLRDIGNPDFIFYTEQSSEQMKDCHSDSIYLRLIRRLSLPTNEWNSSNIRRFMEPWPNAKIPSDHVPLIAEFALCKR